MDDTDALRFSTAQLVFGRTRGGLPFVAIGSVSSSVDVFALFASVLEERSEDFCRRRVTPLLVAGRDVELAFLLGIGGAGEDELPRTGLSCAASMDAPPGSRARGALRRLELTRERAVLLFGRLSLVCWAARDSRSSARSCFSTSSSSDWMRAVALMFADFLRVAPPEVAERTSAAIAASASVAVVVLVAVSAAV